MSDDPGDAGGTTTHAGPDGTVVRFACRPAPTKDFDVVEEVWAANTYEWQESHVRDRPVVDLGANIGAFSLWAAAHGASRVIAVEADPQNLIQFRKNLALNPKLAELINIIEGAAGPEKWYRVRHHASGASSWVDGATQATTETAAAIGQPVGCVEGWDLKAILDLASGDTTHLKCDIEGGEYAFFAAADLADLKRLDNVVLEFHRPGLPGGLGERPRPYSDDPNPFGTLITKLAEHHAVRAYGQPSRGGLIWASRY